MCSQSKRIEIIDFFKGVSILLVILNHTLPILFLNYSLACLWIFQAVPVFLLIQVIHTKRSFDNNKYNIGTWFSIKNFHKILNRIFKPFLFVQVLYIIIYLLSGKNCLSMLYSGGAGGGSYYVWIYLQSWILIPFVYLVQRRFGNAVCLFVCLFVCLACEIFCSLTQLNQGIYRLLVFRYIFLIPLGLIFFKFPIKMNIWKVLLSLFSIVFIIIDSYTDINMEPFIFETVWSGCHWIAYFYTVFIFLYALQYVYKLFNMHLSKITQRINEIGKYSYEIFITQMLLLSIMPGPAFFAKLGMQSILMEYIMVIFKSCLCVIPVLIYKEYKIKCINK